MTTTPFDDLMADLDPPMAILTAAVGDERAGCLIGFHGQASIGPPRYAVWLSRANHTTGVALRATHLAVHLLGDHQHDLAAAFGEQTGDEVDKLAQVAWTAGPDGVPLLDGCRHRIVGRPVSLLDDAGDHCCVVLAPETVDRAGALRPLRLSAVTDLDAGHGP